VSFFCENALHLDNPTISAVTGTYVEARRGMHGIGEGCETFTFVYASGEGRLASVTGSGK